MKKQRLTMKLSVSRTTISKLQSHLIQGGAENASGFLSCKPDPQPSVKHTCEYSCDKKSCYCL